jgi:3-hydroxyphenylacetate 6-hydroxylase
MGFLLSNILGGLKIFSSLSLGALALLIGYVAINEFVRRRSTIPGLGSPPQNIVFGHLPYFAHKGVAEPCREWAQRYGPVYQIKLGNISAVTVNTAAAAKHIFSHQSHATSSRPQLFTLHKVRSKYLHL